MNQSYVRKAGPGARAFAITPHDTNELPIVPRAVYVGGAGDLKLVLMDDDAGKAVTLTAVPAGKMLPVAPRLVLATGTSASLLVGVA